jgi:hypothetical protein
MGVVMNVFDELFDNWDIEAYLDSFYSNGEKNNGN